jgi:hypothetical protein
MQDMGWSPEQAEGVLSLLAPENAGDDKQGPFGICGWTGDRLSLLKDWASSHQRDWRTVEAQLGFLQHELNETFFGLGGQLQQAKTPAAAAAAVSHYLLVAQGKPAPNAPPLPSAPRTRKSLGGRYHSG